MKYKTHETKRLVPRRLSSFSFPWSIALRHQSLAFRARLYAKYEVPEKETASFTFLLQYISAAIAIPVVVRPLPCSQLNTKAGPSSSV